MKFLFLLFAACATSLKPANPNQTFKTDSGFAFQIPKDFYDSGTRTAGTYFYGKKPKSDGSTTILIVRHAPIVFDGKPLTQAQTLAQFEKDIRAGANSERETMTLNVFSKAGYRGAQCLLYNQVGEDRSPKGLMQMRNIGFLCLHPHHPSNFISMSLSQRTPLNKGFDDITQDQEKLFNSLRFF